MIRFASLTALIVAASTTVAMTQSMGPVRSVEVTAELGAVANPTAATYWAGLETDLEAAIATRLAGRIADAGAEISIDVEEVSLSNGFTDTVGLAETRLVGGVNVTDDNDATRSQFYTLSIDVNAATPMMPPGTDVAALGADTRVFYDAMIASFAARVVNDLR